MLLSVDEVPFCLGFYKYVEVHMEGMVPFCCCCCVLSSVSLIMMTRHSICVGWFNPLTLTCRCGNSFQTEADVLKMWFVFYILL